MARGIWLPDGDQHFEGMMDRAPWHFRSGRLTGSYQLDKLQAALAITKKRRVAVDVGAHVGYWSMWLADEFRHVVAFEPVAEHADCFEKNVMQPNVTLHRCAVGASAGLVSIDADDENSGKAHVNGGGDIPMVRLDDVGLAKVDLLKIDVEGYESRVIAGAAQTIQTSKPVIVIEQNDGPRAVETLLEMGMRVHERMGSDWILRW